MTRDLDKKNLLWSFLICLFCILIFPVILPKWQLTYFAPFLIIALYQKPLKICLLLSIAVGSLVDLLSAYPTFGLHATAYAACTLILYPQRLNVFADSLTTLPLMSFAFSSLACFFLASFLLITDIINVFSWSWMFTDMVLLPAIDAVFAFTVFLLPGLVLSFFRILPRRI